MMGRALTIFCLLIVFQFQAQTTTKLTNSLAVFLDCSTGGNC